MELFDLSREIRRGNVSRPATPITEIVPYLAGYLANLKSRNEYADTLQVWYQNMIDHLVAARSAGATHVMYALRSPRLAHNGGPTCIAISVALLASLPIAGRGSNGIATDNPAEIEETVNDVRPGYMSRGVREIIRECETLDRRDAALAAQGYTDEEIMEADDAGLIDDFGNIRDDA